MPSVWFVIALCGLSTFPLLPISFTANVNSFVLQKRVDTIAAKAVNVKTMQLVPDTMAHVTAPDEAIWYANEKLKTKFQLETKLQ